MSDNLCLTCGEKLWATCRCPRANVKCANEHYWARCRVHRDEWVSITKEQDDGHHDKGVKKACTCGKKRERDSDDEAPPKKRARVDAVYTELLQLEEEEIAAIANPVARALLRALWQELKKKSE